MKNLSTSNMVQTAHIFYSKRRKIMDFFLLLNKMSAIRAGINKTLVRIAYRENPNQTASSEAA